MKSSFRLAALSAALALPLVPSIGRADGPGPTDDQKAAARLLGTDGVRAALAGDCRTAVDKLTRAEALVHAPTTALPLAKCEIQLGKLVAGTEILNRLVNEVLPANAPEPWVDAKKQAQPLLDASTPRIGKLRIHVDRPAGATGDVAVTIDGTPIPSVLLDNDRPTDPGAHHVTATASGMTTAQTDVTLAEGQSQGVSLRLTALPAGAPAVASAPGPASSPAPAPALASAPAPAPASPNRGPAYVVLGIGVVGVAVGTIFGVVALGNKSSLNSDCPAGKNACPVSDASTVSSLNSSLNTNAAISTIGLGVGVVGVALGGYLFLSASSSSDAPKTGAIDVHPWLGPGSAGVNGTF